MAHTFEGIGSDVNLHKLNLVATNAIHFFHASDYEYYKRLIIVYIGELQYII